MIRTAARLLRALIREHRLGSFVRHVFLPAWVADRSIRRPIFVLSSSSSGSTWVGAILGELPSHVYVHEVKLYGGSNWGLLGLCLALRPLVPGRFLFVLFETFERARLWTLRSHDRHLRGERPEILTPTNLAPFSLDNPAATNGRVDCVDSSGSSSGIIPLLRKAYPNGVLCYLARDPRDVCASLVYRKGWRTGRSMESWAEAFMTTFHRFERFAAPCDVDLLRYEDWLNDTLGQLRTFVERHRLAATSEELEQAVFRHDQQAIRSGRTPKVGNIVNARAAGWRDELTPEDLAKIEPILRPALERLGYPG